MRNKAKCKICQCIIQTISEEEWVACECGNLAMIGGEKGPRMRFNELSEIVMIDDSDNEVIPKMKKDTEEARPKPTKKELLKILDEMNQRIEEMPPQAAVMAITHYDFSSLLILLASIFRAD